MYFIIMLPSLGGFQISIRLKKTILKKTNSEFPCAALQCKLLNLKWTRSAAEIVLHGGLQYLPSRWQLSRRSFESFQQVLPKSWGCYGGVSAVEQVKRLRNSSRSSWNNPATEKKKTHAFHEESWLVNRDPYFIVYYSPHTTGYYNYDFIPHIH